MAGTDPGQDKQSSEERNDKVLDGLLEERRCVDGPDEPGDVALGDGGSEIE